MTRVPTMPRKQHVQVEQAAIFAWLDEQHTAATLCEIAEHFDISQHSTRRKADGLVAQGKLTVEAGSRIEKGGGATPRRYRTNPDADAKIHQLASH